MSPTQPAESHGYRWFGARRRRSQRSAQIAIAWDEHGNGEADEDQADGAPHNGRQALAGTGPGRRGDTCCSHSLHGVWIIDASDDPGKAGRLQSGSLGVASRRDIHRLTAAGERAMLAVAMSIHLFPADHVDVGLHARSDQRRVRRLLRADAIDCRRHALGGRPLRRGSGAVGRGIRPERAGRHGAALPARRPGLGQRRGGAAGMAQARHRPAVGGDSARRRPGGWCQASGVGGARGRMPRRGRSTPN